MPESLVSWRAEIFVLYGQQQFREALALMFRPPRPLSQAEEGMRDYWAACLHGVLGEREAALSALERVDQRGSWLAPARLEHDFDLASIREDARFQALLRKWRERLQREQVSIRPELTMLEAAGPAEQTLVLLHMNNSSALETKPLFADLTNAGWRVAVAQSGQLGGPDTFIWNNAAQADAEAQAWAHEIGGKPIWAGLSAGGHVVIRNVLTGKLPTSGILAVIPSLPADPAWWPHTLPGVPVALILGEQDALTPDARQLAAKLVQAGQPVRVWTHPGGHDLPPNWLELRDKALKWLNHPTS